MEDPLRIVLGMIGTLAVALALVLGCANALLAWHDGRQPSLQPSLASSLLDNGPIAAGTQTPASSYWSGRP